MLTVQFRKANGPREIVGRAVPGPGPGEVRLRVEACGVCHGDVRVREGGMPGLQSPRRAGHEVIDVVDATGAGVKSQNEFDPFARTPGDLRAHARGKASFRFVLDVTAG
jgi:D-arabinose 1-dehydrogenase-like Zn-dependent alcohol dehydrogenase